MVTPYYQDDIVTIYCGDMVEVMPQLRADVVITDPPYNVRRTDITLAGRSSMKREFGEWDDDGWTPAALLTMAFAILPEGASLLAFTSDRLLSAYRESPGWSPRGTLVWEKLNPAPHPHPAYVQATEFIVWLQKPGAAATWHGGGYTRNILSYAICQGAERCDHPTQKPEALMVGLVARHTDVGQTVLDPFMGTGTTLAAATRIGRKAIGIERERRYCEIAVERIRQAPLPLFEDNVGGDNHE